MKTLGVGGTVFAFGAGAGYAQESGTESGDSPFPPSENTALVRAIHASPDAPAVDVYVNGQQVAQGVQFGNIMDYMDVSPGEIQVQMYPSEDGGQAGATNETTTEGSTLGNETTANETTTEGSALGNETTTNETTANETTTGTQTGAGSASQTPSGEPLIDESVTVEGGQSYTIAAAGRLQNIEALVFEDTPEGEQTEDDQDQNTDSALVRAVNLSPDSGALKVRADSYVVAGALEPEEASNYASLQTGTKQVEVLQTGDADPIATSNYQFEAAERYNLFLVGMVSPEAAQAEGGVGNQTGTGNATGVGNATTTEAGLGNATTEVGATNETTTEAGLGNETTTEAGAMNETTTEGSALGNETTANETTTEAGLGNETTTEAGATGNESATGGGLGSETSGMQTQPADFQIVAVQDSDGSILEEAEPQTPSADDLLPIDLGGGNETAQNETAQNGTATTTENETTTGAAENETVANGTTTNGTTTEAGNTTTSS